MNKRTVVIIIIAGVLIVGAATAWMMLQPSQQASAPPSTDSSTKQSPSASGKEVTVMYTDSGFEPKNVTAKKGDTLRVVNESANGLQFSSDSHPTHRDNPELNMDTLEPGESGMLALTKAGEWGFHNHLKDEDTGVLTVTE
ncbi:MAG TPA: cupredoxin domain-containing protein [Candidatus Saccharimonadales bacterium]